jgi:hypothetical protein
MTELEWVVHNLDEHKIVEFLKKWKTFPKVHIMFGQDVRDRAWDGGQNIRSVKEKRDVGHNDNKEGRDNNEFIGKLFEESVSEWIRLTRPHWPVYPVDYSKKQGKALLFSLDVAALRAKGCPTTPYIWNWGKPDEFGRVGPSWMIHKEELNEENTIYVPDESVSVFGLVNAAGTTQICGWCTYKDLRDLRKAGLLTPTYSPNIKDRKEGVFLFDLLEQNLLKPMSDLTDDQILNPKVMAAAKAAEEADAAEAEAEKAAKAAISPQWHKEE